jgi:hypothetical protein
MLGFPPTEGLCSMTAEVELIDLRSY